MNEFYSIGFYMSDHPLKDYEKYLKESKIISFHEFMDSNESNGIVAGTIMSIQEKKITCYDRVLPANPWVAL